jgi:hypothetical protein
MRGLFARPAKRILAGASVVCLTLYLLVDDWGYLPASAWPWIVLPDGYWERRTQFADLCGLGTGAAFLLYLLVWAAGRELGYSANVPAVQRKPAGTPKHRRKAIIAIIAAGLGLTLSGLLALIELEKGRHGEAWGPLQMACANRGVPGTAAFSRAEVRLHPIVVFGGPMYKDWLPATLAATELVACVEAREELIERCTYTLGGSMSRYQHKTTVRVMEALTGTLLREKTLLGTEPKPCPKAQPVGDHRSHGSIVSGWSVEAWLKPIVSPTAKRPAQ